ncbi:uncharacterized protein [Rutidosis leptorrhynchoides]|uniref:uncharacterized protein n=1 Tax=Rutidosis leptorrhynchoides TaxID=125765 RepID=UPI003A98EEEA
MAPKKYEKIYTVTSVHHLIPVKLDLSKLNYTHWKKLFTTHCAGFDVSNFILRDSTPEEKADPDWVKADAVVSTWIYLTISESLLERVLNSEPSSAYDAWSFLDKVFKDNKQSKTMELQAELRGLNIGNSSVEEYFRQIDRIAAHFKNLGSNMEESDLVMYVVNGLNEKYAHTKHIIIHRAPFPDLNMVRSMLSMEEMTINRTNQPSASLPNSSHPSALVAQAQPANTVNQNTTISTQVCRNFSKGHCRFADKCRFLHPGSNRSHGTGNSRTQQQMNRPNSSLSQAQLLNIIAAQQHQLGLTNSRVQLGYQTGQPLLPSHVFGPPIPPTAYGPPARPTAQQAQQGLLPTPPGFTKAAVGQPNYLGSNATGQPTAYYTNPNSGYASFTVDPTQTQETILPQAFSTMTLQDYGNAGWHMDTGASTHLTSCINTLSTVFNNRRYPSVAVGNGSSIPVTNTDYLTRRLLLRCDGTGDLYPVTSPESHPPPHALLISFDTWHQRLVHPGHDAFRRLISNKDILYLWTSPVASLSGLKYYIIFLDHYSHYCAQTSQQNGKSERMLRTINNLIRTLLFQAHLPPTYWVEALHMAAYILNILPSSAINHDVPYTRLYHHKPNYTTLRVFGCLCYPHLNTTNKLAPRSTPCIFLGYPSNHRGYRCLNLTTNRIILS